MGDEVELPPDFEERYGFIAGDHSGVDLTRLRQQHRRVKAAWKQELKRRQRLEAELDRLRLLEAQAAALAGALGDKIVSLEAEAAALRALLIKIERQTLRPARGKRLVSVPITLDRPNRGLRSAA